MEDGFQLAIESSAERASVALGRAGQVVFSKEVVAGRRQSEVLMGPLEEALAEVEGSRIGLVMVGTGPGSYNGARVGIAAGQGVALVHGCPAIGLCSLEALAAVRSGEACLALGDARRGTFFTLELREGKLSGKPDLLEHEKFVRQVAAWRARGDNLVTLEDPVRLRLPPEIAEVVEWAAPAADLLLAAYWARSEAEREELEGIPPQPFYLRPPHITKPAGEGDETSTTLSG